MGLAVVCLNVTGGTLPLGVPTPVQHAGPLFQGEATCTNVFGAALCLPWHYSELAPSHQPKRFLRSFGGGVVLILVAKEDFPAIGATASLRLTGISHVAEGRYSGALEVSLNAVCTEDSTCSRKASV